MIYLHLWNPCHPTFSSYLEQSKGNFGRAPSHVIIFFHIHSCCLHTICVLNFSGLLRSILGNLGAPRHVRFLAYAKCAIYGLEEHSKLESGMSQLTLYVINSSLTLILISIAVLLHLGAINRMFLRVKTDISYLHLRIIIGNLQHHHPARPPDLSSLCSSC